MRTARIGGVEQGEERARPATGRRRAAGRRFRRSTTEIIGMVDEAVRAAADEGLAGRTMIRVVQRGAERWRGPRCAPVREARTSPARSRRSAGRAQATKARRATAHGPRRSTDNGRGAMLARAMREQPPRVAVATATARRGAASVTSARITMFERHAASSISPAQVKPGPKAVIITRSGRPRSKQAVEHEQHGRRAHVAIVAQHLALEVELALVEVRARSRSRR